MANQKHLDILMQGVEMWNKWRKEHPEIHPDLKEATLRKADLKEANLRESDLFGAYFRGAFLPEADLSETELRMSNFSS